MLHRANMPLQLSSQERRLAYTGMHMLLYTHTLHIYIYMFICSYRYRYMYICIYIYIYMYTYRYLYLFKWLLIYLCMHVYTLVITLFRVLTTLPKSTREPPGQKVILTLFGIR